MEKECSLQDFEQAQRWFGGTLRVNFFALLPHWETAELALKVSMCHYLRKIFESLANNRLVTKC